MLGRMHLLFDSFWRAAVYCLRPRVMFLSLLPLLLMGGLFLGLGYLYWTPATEALRLWLETATWLGSISTWLTSLGVVKLEAVLAPLLLAFVVTPLIVVISLLVVSFLMTPTLTALVATVRKVGTTALLPDHVHQEMPPVQVVKAVVMGLVVERVVEQVKVPMAMLVTEETKHGYQQPTNR